LENTINDKQIIYISQGSFKLFIKQNFGIEILKKPDEAFIIGANTDNAIIVILEKKNQNVPGSVIEKIWACCMHKEAGYQMVFNESKHKHFKVEYAFCLNNYLFNEVNKEKYTNYLTILKNNDIEIFAGEKNDYFNKLYEWIIKMS